MQMTRSMHQFIRLAVQQPCCSTKRNFGDAPHLLDQGCGQVLLPVMELPCHGRCRRKGKREHLQIGMRLSTKMPFPSRDSGPRLISALRARAYSKCCIVLKQRVN